MRATVPGVNHSSLPVTVETAWTPGSNVMASWTAEMAQMRDPHCVATVEWMSSGVSSQETVYLRGEDVTTFLTAVILVMSKVVPLPRVSISGHIQHVRTLQKEGRWCFNVEMKDL